jgi:hypothetical protein
MIKSQTVAFALAAAVLGSAAPAAAEDWHPFSRSARIVYLADVTSVVQAGDVTTVRIAKVPIAAPAPGNMSHTVDEFAFRCAAGQYRVTATSSFAADASLEDRFEDEAEWEDVVNETFPAYLKEIACEGAMADPPTWPTLRAFMDSRT